MKSYHISLNLSRPKKNRNVFMFLLDSPNQVSFFKSATRRVVLCHATPRRWAAAVEISQDQAQPKAKATGVVHRRFTAAWLPKPASHYTLLSLQDPHARFYKVWALPAQVPRDFGKPACCSSLPSQSSWGCGQGPPAPAQTGLLARPETVLEAGHKTFFPKGTTLPADHCSLRGSLHIYHPTWQGYHKHTRSNELAGPQRLAPRLLKPPQHSS